MSDRVVNKVGKNRDESSWTVCEDLKKYDVRKHKEYYATLGVSGFDFNEVKSSGFGKKTRISFLVLLQHLWPGDWMQQVKRMNRYVKHWNKNVRRQTERVVQLVTHRELWVFLKIMLVGRIECIPGGDLWKDDGKTEG